MMNYLILPIILLFQMFLLSLHLPYWVTQIGFTLWLISLIPVLKNLAYITWITGLGSLAATVIIIKEFNFVLSNELIASLLVILTTLRLIEYNPKKQKSENFLYLLGLFLAMTKFVFQIDLVFGFYALVMTLFYLYQFLPLSYRKNFKKESLYLLAQTLVISIPITVILFVIFPQFKNRTLTGSKFGFLTTIGTAGFSGDLKPGMISDVIDSGEIAFRAEFDQNYQPEIKNLYWRGQVLDRPLGLHWRKSNPISSHHFDISTDDVHQKNTTKDIYRYKITLDPHRKTNLFTLYGTTNVISQDKIYKSLKNKTYGLATPLEDKTLYQGFFNPTLSESFDQATKDYDENFYKHLNRRSKQVTELLNHIEKKSLEKLSRQQKASEIGKYFSNHQFTYRLTGLSTQKLSLEDFLFTSKVGFCEHYASAAALMFRHWDIPSRVVVGYHGGNYNHQGQFWTVAQKDAHAWVEYLNESNQWVLFDPLAFIAPDRLTMGSAAHLKSKIFLSYFRNVDAYLEYLNYRWNLFFIEYSNQQIRSSLALIIQPFLKYQIFIFYGLFLLIVFVILKSIRHRLYVRFSLNYRTRKFFHRHFEKLNIPQKKDETFSAWQSRITTCYPQHQEIIEKAFCIYLNQRFGPQIEKKQLKQLKTLLRLIQ